MSTETADKGTFERIRRRCYEEPYCSLLANAQAMAYGKSGDAPFDENGKII